MKHNWDVHSNTECDTCVTCGLRRKMVANMKGLIVSVFRFREYWVHNKWMQSHDTGSIGRSCPGKQTDYNHINIQQNEKNPNGAIVIPLNYRKHPNDTDKRTN